MYVNLYKGEFYHVIRNFQEEKYHKNLKLIFFKNKIYINRHYFHTEFSYSYILFDMLY